MKCPQCGLNNLEHIEVCVKCGWLLVTGSLPEDFSPETPRAGRLNKIKRLYWKWRRSRRIVLPENSYEPKVSFWKDPFKSFSYGEPVPGSLLAMLLSFLLPGLGQLLMGRRIRGTIFIIPSLLALFTFALGMYNYSLDVVRMSVNIYLVFQSISVFDAMPRIRAVHVTDWFINIFLAVMVWVGCFIAVSNGMTSAINYFWEEGELQMVMYNYPDKCAIHSGDTILVQKKQSYSRGDIVVYTSMPYLYGNNFRWNDDYIGIDKVIGLPGETVSVKNGRVSVNSVELDNQAELTLRTCKIPDMQWNLGGNEYFIITSIMPPLLLKRFPDSRKASVMNVDRITGRITRIVAPLGRIRKL